MNWLSGIKVSLDAHLPGPGGRGEELELPTGQEILTALRNKEGGGEGRGVGGCWEEGHNGNFYNLIKLLKNKRKSEDPGQMCCRLEETIGCKNRLLYPAKFSITINGENKIFHDKNSN